MNGPMGVPDINATRAAKNSYVAELAKWVVAIDSKNVADEAKEEFGKAQKRSAEIVNIMLSKFDMDQEQQQVPILQVPGADG